MPYTILRTAAGSPVAPSIIRALRTLPDVRVVAADADPLSSGFQVADQAYTVPRVDDPDFLEAMLAICADASVDLLFPDLDEELPLLARERAAFEALGTRILLSDAAAVDLCRDKYATASFFSEHGIPAPETFLPEDLAGASELPFPLFIKPRSGRGSQHVFKITAPDELAFFTTYVKQPIIQEFVQGIEYTVDTLSDLEGQMLYCSIRQRLATDSGISMKGKTVAHPFIRACARRIVEGIGLVGPACVQCIEDEAGAVKFIEVNPRVAGSAVLSMAAGAPIVTDAVRLMQGRPPQGPVNYRLGYVMLRYWNEVFIDDAPQRGLLRS